MTPQKHPKPLVIMVIGFPGAGKSFFARHFSMTYGAAVVSFDRLQFELFNKALFSSQELDLLRRIMGYQMEELFKTKRSFIVDGSCNTKAERTAIEEKAQKLGYDTLTIWIQTEETTAMTRATKRKPRKPDDRYNPAITPQQFATTTKQFNPPQREAYVVVSGRHTPATQVKTVLRKLAGAGAENTAKPAAPESQVFVRRGDTPPRRLVIR